MEDRTAPADTGALFRPAAAVAAAVVGAAAVLLAGPVLDDLQKALVSSTLFVLCSLAATVCCVHAARRTDTARLRRSWLFFAGASAAWTVGSAFWFYQQIQPSQTYPTPSDPFYLSAFALSACGLLVFPIGTREPGDRARLVLDGLSITASLLFLSHLVVLDTVFANLGSGLAAVVLTAYPLSDVMLGSIAVLLLSRSADRRRWDLILLSCGLLTYAVADTSFALQSARGEFRAGTPLDLAWIGGILLVGLAALTSSSRTAEQGRLRSAGSSALGAVLVYGIMGLAVAVGAYQGVRDWVDVALGVLLLVLVGLRQTVLAADNNALREGLEARVADRTADLERLALHHQRILDAVGEGIYGVDGEGRITFVNPAAAQLLGHDPQDLLGRPAHAAFHAVDTDPRGGRCHLDEAIRSGEVVRRSDETYLRRDGTPFPVEITAAPHQDAEAAVGAAVGAVVVFSDISARRAVERMKQEFISVVSHELRTPLTSIRGSLGLLAGGAVDGLPPGTARMVQIALDNSDRLTRLINDILDVERIESGSLPLEFAVHTGAELVTTAVTALRPAAETAGVTLVAGAASGRVHADADRIVQALTNLVGNAVKFSRPGDEVTVSAEPDGAHVTFSVADQGRGIPAEKLESIFDRFQQVDSSDAREKGGTGLGLAITRSIVDRHGGRVWAESEPGRGAVFRFTLPAVGDAAPPPTDPGTAGTAPTVLLCDDDPDVLEVLSTLLREHGYAATAVARGRDAVDRAVIDRPDVILLDLRMPGMSGWEAIRELKARPQTRGIPIVVMSALTPAVDPDLAARTEGWLTKPVDTDRMDRLLAAAVGGGHRPTALIVEDDDDLAAVLVAIFQQRGLRAVRAATQQDAIAQLADLRPDVLVLDLYLPDGDGYGVVDQLRRDGRLCDVPVVVYSAHQLDAADRERLRLGELAFLTKGVDSPDELARRVVGVVDRVGMADAAVTDVVAAGPAVGDR